MEETNIAGLTFAQRLEIINANQNKSQWEHFRPVVDAFVWTVGVFLFMYGIYSIGYYFYNYYHSKRNK